MPFPRKTPRILAVDDDEGLLILMTESLQAEGFEVVAVRSGEAALHWLAKHTPDLMLLDLKMRDVGGVGLLKRLKQRDAPVPFIVVTGQGDEKIAVEVMKQGALDYVMKGSGLMDLLPGVVRKALDHLAQQQALTAAGVKQRRLEKEMVEIAERERQRIGADLHDGLGQQLTAIELYCAGLKATAQRQPEFTQSLDRMGKMLRESIRQTRALAHGLVPVGDDPDALRIALTGLAESTNSLGRLRCRLECPEPAPPLNHEVAGHLYRIAQEAVNNALKHAGAGEVVIRLVPKGGALQLQVADDGKGLPAKQNAGIGLGVMQHRASVIGAELVLTSKPGSGVAVTCTLPLTP